METIDLKGMKNLCCKDTVKVNVLSEGMHNKDHIPGSINIPVDDIEELAPKVLPDKSQHIVVYCANADCSASPKAAQKLESMGYENVYDFEGGLEEWNEKKEECCKSKEDKEGGCCCRKEE